MPLRPWPVDDDKISFDSIVNDFALAIRFAYTLRRKNYWLEIPYNGHDIPEWLKASCLPADQQVTMENLVRQEKDQGRPALDVILGVALQVAMEIGYRRGKKDARLELLMGELKETIE